MKKAKKRKPGAAKPKRREKKKEATKPQSRSRPAPAGGVTELFASPFDFAESAQGDSSAGLLTRARAQLAAGKPEEALALCREVISASPNDAGAFNLAGVAAFQSGETGEGLDLLRTAVAFAPDDPEAQTNLGNALAALAHPEEAEAAYRTAIEADPAYAEAHFNLGILMESGARHEEARAAYARALEITPGHAGARQGLGNALKALKRLDEARAAYEAALAHNPALPEARTNLAAVLQELGDFAGAESQCRRALETAPGLMEARYNLGIALQEQGRYEAAIEAYKEVLAREPDHAAAMLNIAYGLQQLGRLDEAAKAFGQTLRIDPDFAKAWVNLADLRLQQGDPEAALKVCDDFLERRPASTDLLAFKAVALQDLGRAEDARKLIDFDRFLRPVRISPPGDFASLEDFNAALAEHVLNHPTLTFAPQSHATREGRHSGELLDAHKGPIAGLEQAILQAAEAYRQEAGRDPDHPFLAAPPEKLTLSVWGVVMQSAGHQVPHIHPAAWLSGVYYAKVPDIVGEETVDKAGWIEFGRPPAHFHNSAEPETRPVRPEPGLMVLFPSYFYHHTVPFEGEGTRISIAFDLMPA